MRSSLLAPDGPLFCLVLSSFLFLPAMCCMSIKIWAILVIIVFLDRKKGRYQATKYPIFQSHPRAFSLKSTMTTMPTTEKTYRCAVCYDEKSPSDMLPIKQCQCRYPTVCWQCFRGSLECGLKSEVAHRRIPTQCWVCHTPYVDGTQMLRDADILDISALPFVHPLYRVEGALAWTLSACLSSGPLLLPMQYYMDMHIIDMSAIQFTAQVFVAILVTLYILRWATDVRNHMHAARHGTIRLTMLPNAMYDFFEVGYWPPTMLVIAQLLLVADAPSLFAYLALFIGCFDWETPSASIMRTDRNTLCITLIFYALSDKLLLLVQDTMPVQVMPRNIVFCAALSLFTMWLACKLFPLIFNRFLYDKELCPTCNPTRRNLSLRSGTSGFGYACDRFVHDPRIGASAIIAMFILAYPSTAAFLWGYAHTDAIHFCMYFAVVFSLWPVVLTYTEGAVFFYDRLCFYWNPPYALTTDGQYEAFRRLMGYTQSGIGQIKDLHQHTVLYYCFEAPQAPAPSTSRPRA